MDVVGELMSLLKEVFLSPSFPDKRIWTLKSLGKFSSKSLFTYLSHPCAIPSPFPVKQVWKPPVPSRIKAFSWTVVLDRLNTMEMLQMRRPFLYLSPSWCVLCKSEGESANHLFMHCRFAKAIWDHFFEKLHWQWVMPGTIYDLFWQWTPVGLGELGKYFWRCLIHAVLWGIWRERNLGIFEGRSRSCNEVIDSIIQEVGSWLLVSKEFLGLSLVDFIRDWVSCISSYSFKVCESEAEWQHPPFGLLKLNFDGSSLGNPGPGGFGCVIRDHNGLVLRYVAGPLGSCNSTKAEVMGLHMGLRELKSLGIGRVVVEGNSKVVVGWARGSYQGTWLFSNFIHEIWDLALFLNVSISHVPRSRNTLADKFAKWGVGLKSRAGFNRVAIRTVFTGIFIQRGIGYDELQPCFELWSSCRLWDYTGFDF